MTCLVSESSLSVSAPSITAFSRTVLPSAASFPAGVMEVSEHEVKEWFSPRDLGIGKTIHIMGRKFLLYVRAQAHRHHVGIPSFPLTQLRL